MLTDEQCTATVRPANSSCELSLGCVAIFWPANPYEAQSGARAMPRLRVYQHGLEYLDDILITSLILKREQLPPTTPRVLRKGDGVKIGSPDQTDSGITV